MNHLSWDDLWAYADGEHARPVQTEEHLRQCEICSANLAKVKSTDVALKRLLGAGARHGSEARTEQIFNQLRAIHAASDQSSSGRPRRRWMWLSSGASATAAVVIGGVLGYHALQSPAAHGGLSPATSTVALSTAENVADSQPDVNSTVDLSGSSTPSTADQSVRPFASQLKAGAADTVAGDTQVVVEDESRKPLSGVHIAYVVNGNVGPVVTTDPQGKTPDEQLTVPVDPMLKGFFSTDFPPEGVIGVVAWKDGYQPIVHYDVGVFENGTPYQPTLVMRPTNQPNSPVIVEGSGVRGDYGVPVVGGLPYTAEKWLGEKAKTADSVTAGNSTLKFTVVDENGQPVSGADVVVFANGRVTGFGSTEQTGKATVKASGVRDWRLPTDAKLDNGHGTIASVFVLKKGYAPAIGLYQPVAPKVTRNIHVQLDSYSHRAKQGVNNTDSPTTILGDVIVSTSDASQLYKFVQTHAANP